MIVYKVVRKENEKYYSTLISPKYVIEYELGKLITPKIGKIFIFKELKYARFYKAFLTDYIILECETSEEIQPLAYRALCDEKSIEYFWSNNDFEYPWHTPAGTYVVNSLTPLRVVY